MSIDFYAKLQSPIERSNSSVLDELRVSVDYCKGGFTYAYGCSV